MEDLPIGSEIVLKVVEDKKGECNGCFLDDMCNSIYDCICRSFARTADNREDGKNVQFKRVK